MTIVETRPTAGMWAGQPMQSEAGERVLRPMPGLEDLVRVLRCPETLFGGPSDRLAKRCTHPIDWESAPETLRAILEPWGTRCMDVVFHLQLGAEVLRRHGVQICRGEAFVLFLAEEGPPDVFIQICLDTSIDRASELTWELNDRANDFDVPSEGFCIAFITGEPSAEDLESLMPFEEDEDLEL
ncbi:hypothetical protein CDN99_15105 [Roseateles aquatilis]|uniref:Uncharacterized protein n=1 Tax=Roseateles aquatilis TaxID=431061 RepID=A0A246J8B9_9BURK|nr:hypothetical protein [Roseateles aquatilis]OWQ88806.1 hypothetical protein CDN99_15105 [Roseateles aquatilis]